jgi:hypothetical protein
MNEKSKGNEKIIRGFAGVLAKQILAINENSEFNEDFKDQDQLKYLLVPTDEKYAALITIDHGTIDIDSIENHSPNTISRKDLGWDGLMACSMQTFLELALGRLSMMDLGIKMLKGKVKVKKIFKLLKLQKIFKYLT